VNFGREVAKQTSIDQYRKRVEAPQVTKDADYIAHSKSFDQLVLTHFAPEAPQRHPEALEALAAKAADVSRHEPVRLWPQEPLDHKLKLEAPHMGKPFVPQKDKVSLLDILDESSDDEESNLGQSEKRVTGVAWGGTSICAAVDELDALLADI
jgi:hypothetical protein